jgi:hypothetical protein
MKSCETLGPVEQSGAGRLHFYVELAANCVSVAETTPVRVAGARWTL